MQDKQPVSKEVVIKEYPNSTQWLEEKQVIGVGNLILTNERLIFIHRLPLEKKELESLQKISKKVTVKRMIDLALSLHQKNFQVPLSSVISAETGLHSLLPFPRPCLRIHYRSERKQTKTLAFIFTVPLWKSWFQLEFSTVKGWVWSISRALQHKQSVVQEEKTK